MDLNEFTKLKNELETLKRKAAQADGALAQLRANLNRIYHVKNLKEGKAVLAELQRKKNEADKAYQSLKAEYKKKFGDKHGE